MVSRRQASRARRLTTPVTNAVPEMLTTSAKELSKYVHYGALGGCADSQMCSLITKPIWDIRN